MESKKVTIDGKEVEIKLRNVQKLSDDDLNQVQGGVILPGSPDDTTVYQFVCKICGWKSNWFTDYTKYESNEILAPHISETSHNDFRCEEFALPKG
ncbi:hypothetical protein [Petroclostridium sp. X23]|uniref:hypothetical protein n=1 Tax=Petroclostridium sp. X23 TaxID=3045146 RepID=UPI0024AE1356|nr:hypothetical protein [Petroclostridium sp. X23]WHH60554.1 hypothetical protein QKW49_07550 [Petroclostridium sp. X23]